VLTILHYQGSIRSLEVIPLQESRQAPGPVTVVGVERQLAAVVEVLVFQAVGRQRTTISVVAKATQVQQLAQAPIHASTQTHTIRSVFEEVAWS
jgi:hypothetical protein